jgi:hypothetical protein
MNYYFEFGGGLGDIFFRMFAENEYRKIDAFSSEDRARISLITVNPFADEIFKWHPKQKQLSITLFPHWWPHEEIKKRKAHNLPSRDEISRVDHTSDVVNFYPSACDLDVISQLKRDEYFVFAASAGSEDRILNSHIVSLVCKESVELKVNLFAVGRNYSEQRGGMRYEPRVHANEYVSDLVDTLSIPGVAKLIEGAKGVICSHSSICILSWFLNKPVLLLYPDSVYQHILNEPSSGYFLGLNKTTTRHSTFKSCTSELVRNFITFCLSIK